MLNWLIFYTYQKSWSIPCKLSTQEFELIVDEVGEYHGDQDSNPPNKDKKMTSEVSTQVFGGQLPSTCVA